MKVLQVNKFDKIHEIIISENIDAKLDYYAEVLMTLVEIKKLIDNEQDNDDGSESDSDDDNGFEGAVPAIKMNDDVRPYHNFLVEFLQISCGFNSCGSRYTV